MELIAAILIAGPLGYFGGKRGLMLYLVLWAIVFPIQTIDTHRTNPDDLNVLYYVVNALILALGIGLNRLGSRLRKRREQKAQERASVGAPA
jgi:hypothetical protein